MKPTGLVLALSLILAAPGGSHAAAQAPAQPAVGAPLPDAVTLAIHAAIEQVLTDKAAQIQGPAQDPNGAPFGDVVKMGLVLEKDTTIAQFQQAQAQLAALKTASPAVREAELAKIRELAVEARDAYQGMRAIEHDELRGDMNGEARGLYETTMRDADSAEKAGQTGEADALRQKAADTRWGRYLAARQRFAKALGAHPLLGVRITHVLGDEAYFFNRVLESAVKRNGTGASVAGLLKQMDDHIDEAIAQLHAQELRVVNMTTWQQLWELGNPAFAATQKQATRVGGDLGKGLVDAVTGTNTGAAAVSAYNNAWSDTAWSIVQVGSMIVPIAGPLISAGITGLQIYKSGDEYVIALDNLTNAEQGATVTGYQTVIEAKDALGAARGKLVVNVAMAPAEIPGLMEAFKAGKVLIKRGATAARNAKAALTGSEEAAKAAQAAEGSATATGAVRTGSAAEETRTATGAAGKTGLAGGMRDKAVVFEGQERVAIADLKRRAEDAIKAGVPEADVHRIVDETMTTVQAERGDTAFEAIAQSDLELAEKTFRARNPTARLVSETEAELVRSVRSKAALEARGRPQTWSPQELSKLREMGMDPSWTNAFEYDNPFNIEAGDQPGFHKLGNAEDVGNVKEANRRTATQTLPETGEPPRRGAGDRAAPTSGQLQLDLKKAGQRLKDQATKTITAFADPLKIEGLKPNQVAHLTDQELARIRTADFNALPDGELKTALFNRIRDRSAAIARAEEAAAARITDLTVGGAVVLNAAPKSETPLPGSPKTSPNAIPYIPEGVNAGGGAPAAPGGSATKTARVIGKDVRSGDQVALEALVREDIRDSGGNPDAWALKTKPDGGSVIDADGSQTYIGPNGQTLKVNFRNGGISIDASPAAPPTNTAGGAPTSSTLGLSPGSQPITSATTIEGSRDQQMREQLTNSAGYDAKYKDHQEITNYRTLKFFKNPDGSMTLQAPNRTYRAHFDANGLQVEDLGPTPANNTAGAPSMPANTSSGDAVLGPDGLPVVKHTPRHDEMPTAPSHQQDLGAGTSAELEEAITKAGADPSTVTVSDSGLGVSGTTADGKTRITAIRSSNGTFKVFKHDNTATPSGSTAAPAPANSAGGGVSAPLGNTAGSAATKTARVIGKDVRSGDQVALEALVREDIRDSGGNPDAWALKTKPDGGSVIDADGSQTYIGPNGQTLKVNFKNGGISIDASPAAPPTNTAGGAAGAPTAGGATLGPDGLPVTAAPHLGRTPTPSNLNVPDLGAGTSAELEEAITKAGADPSTVTVSDSGLGVSGTTADGKTRITAIRSSNGTFKVFKHDNATGNAGTSKTPGGTNVGGGASVGGGAKAPVPGPAPGAAPEAPCAEAADACAGDEAAYNDAVDAYKNAKSDLDAAVAKTSQTAAGLSAAGAAMEAAQKAGGPQLAAATAQLQSAKTADADAVAAQTAAGEKLAAAEQAARDARAALEACEAKAAEKCQPKAETPPPPPAPGANAIGGGAAATKPGANTAGGGETPAPGGGNTMPGGAGGGNVVGKSAAAPSAPACKRADSDCDALRQYARERQAAADTAARALPFAQNDLAAAAAADRSANENHDQAMKAYATAAGYAKLGDKVNAESLTKTAGEFDARGNAYSAQAQQLRAEAAAIKATAEKTAADAAAAWSAYTACMQLPPCPEDTTSTSAVPTNMMAENGRANAGGGVGVPGGTPDASGGLAVDTGSVCGTGNTECVPESACVGDCVDMSQGCEADGTCTSPVNLDLIHQLMFSAASTAMSAFSGDEDHDARQDSGSRSMPGVLRALPRALAGWVRGAGRFASRRSQPIELAPGTLITFEPRQRKSDAQPAAPPLTLVATGSSTGDAFRVVDPSGKHRKIAMPEGLVLQAIKQPGRASSARPAASSHSTPIGAFCLEFAKLPPSAGMLYQVAPAALQQKFKSLRSVLQAATRLQQMGGLHPDSNPKSYADSIKQYALWTQIGHWDAKTFKASFVELTKKNVTALKQHWTQAMETAIEGAAPGRWRDIQAILQEAQTSAGHGDR